jgi:hypothetical protein
MQEKTFAEMSLDEMFDFEARNSPCLGRSVVTEEGVARHNARLSQATRRLPKVKKRRAPAKHAAA